MWIDKLDDLNFEQGELGRDDNIITSLEFEKSGLLINKDVLSWDDIKTAYKKLFGKEINAE